jgi:hypothetical protein
MKQFALAIVAALIASNAVAQEIRQQEQGRLDRIVEPGIAVAGIHLDLVHSRDVV